MEKMRNRRLHVRALPEGLFLSAGLSLFFYYGISLAYRHLPGSVVVLTVLTVLCFLMFWLIIRFDRYLDVNEVFYKTIAPDFKSVTSGAAGSFIRFIRRINPYLGFAGTISGLMVLLWGVPSLIMYMTVHPGPHTHQLKICVLFMDISMGTGYLFLAGEKFPFLAEKAMFFAGILIGSALVVPALPF